MRGVWVRAAYCIVAVVMGSGLVACDPPASGTLIVAIQVFDPTGTDIEGLSAMELSVARVDVVHRTDATDPATEEVLTVSPNPITAIIDDLDVGGRDIIGAFDVPPGFVFQVRLIVDNLTFIIDGEAVDVFAPSGEQTGIKLVPAEGAPQLGDPFEIEADQTTAVLALYDPGHQVVVNPGRGVIEKPVVPAAEVDPGSLGLIADPLQLIIRFSDSATTADINNVISTHNLTVRHIHAMKPLYTVAVPDPSEVSDLHDALEDEPVVEFASGNYIFQLLQNDPLRSSEFWLPANNVINAWVQPLSLFPFPIGGGGTLVATIDNGFDMDHPDLIFNYAINQGEIPVPIFSVWQSDPARDVNGNGRLDFEDLADSINADLICGPGVTASDTCCPADRNPNLPMDICDPLDLVDGQAATLVGWEDGPITDDGNGYPDDLVGWDFASTDTLIGDNLPEPNTTPDEGDVRFLTVPGVGVVPFSHGTATTGMGAAVGNNGLALVGVTWRAQIVPLRTSLADFTRLGPFVRGGFAGFIVEAIDYAVDRGVPVLSMQMGLSLARRRLGDRGCNTEGSLRVAVLGGRKFRKLSEDVREAWDELDISSLVFVTGLQDCNFDSSPTDDYFEWPTHFARPTQVRVTSTNELGMIAQGFGASVAEIAARADLAVAGPVPYFFLAYTPAPITAVATACPPAAGFLNICIGASTGGGTSFAIPQVAQAFALVFDNGVASTPDAAILSVLGGARPTAPTDRVANGAFLDVCGALYGVPFPPGC